MANSAAAVARSVASHSSPETVVASAKALPDALRRLEPQANLGRSVPAETIRAFMAPDLDG